MHLVERCPLHIIGFTGQKLDLIQGHIFVQAIEIVQRMGILIRIQQFKLRFLRCNAGFLEKLSADGLQAGLPCLGCAAGIFPGAGKTFSLGKSNKKRAAKQPPNTIIVSNPVSNVNDFCVQKL